MEKIVTNFFKNKHVKTFLRQTSIFLSIFYFLKKLNLIIKNIKNRKIYKKKK